MRMTSAPSPGGIATPVVYAQLLSLYLLQNDLANAKFLWKRIPPPIKSSNPELNNIWMVGQKMWQRDFPQVYQSLNQEWSENIKPIMQALHEDVRSRAFQLVSKAYSSIGTEDFAHFIGMPTEQAVSAAAAEGWQIDTQNKLIVPKKPATPQDPPIPSEQQLAQLTEFVAYLEN
ncbi:COP9 signalosome complex subunit 8-like isoform X2 [Ptychodera flava]|uniref:COP9 signalosome complex subunit 8-like isoform X2 n=1 Tax=Ptychodera flava TaxID=63121 RepID=UPI003969CDBD